MLIEEFNRTIDIWIKQLDQYSFKQLRAKPSPTSWSLGQVYIHLIDETKYYIEQIKICLSSNENLIEEASVDAKTMFSNNDFPNAQIEGASTNSLIPQPENKEQLKRLLKNVKEEMNKTATSILNSSFKGKTKHPGLNYFSADEWLQFAEMHFRHHMRQKKRIDNFLKKTSIS